MTEQHKSRTAASRRWRLLAFLLAFTLIVAACGGDDDDDAGGDDPSVSGEAPAASDDNDMADGDMADGDMADDDAGASDDDSVDTAADSGVAAVSDCGTLDYLGWEGYDTFFGANEAVLADLGIEFNSAYIGSGNDIVQRFASGGGGGLDLLSWTTADHRSSRSVEGMLSPITVEEVPNLALLSEPFANDSWGHFLDENGDWLAIPFSFAPLGITYDSSKVSPTSYADLLDDDYTGLLGVPDVPSLHLQSAAGALGYSADDVTPDQLNEIIEYMRPLFAQARTISPSFGDIIGLLASGEIVAAYGGYPGLGAFTENPDIVTVFPEEQTTGYIEVYSIPAEADKRECALAFINAMLDPEVNAAINEAFAQATPITDSVPLMSEANAALYPYEDLDSFLAANPMSAMPDGSNGTITMGDFIEAYGTLLAGG